tara:strand:+ start:242 stop:466 length:225 start_codon:yes stop_codon:yes gene_type:complete
MDKQKIVKLTWPGLKTLLKSPNFLINVIMVLIALGVIILSIVDDDWSNAGVFGAFFFWFLTGLWRKLKNFKKKK